MEKINNNFGNRNNSFQRYISPFANRLIYLLGFFFISYRERTFGCDLGEHLAGSGRESKCFSSMY